MPGIVLVLLFLVSCVAQGASYDRLVVFGDSMSDTGNLYALTGGASPADPPYDQGRYSNGQVWPEFVAADLGVPLENHAHGSALTGYDNLEGAYPGMRTQVDAYIASHPLGANPDSLYVVWAGANDFFGLQSAGDVPDMVDSAVNHIVTVVTQLSFIGARHIVVGLLPDLGRTPYANAPGALLTPSNLTALSGFFNDTLRGQIESTGIPVRILDSFELLQRVSGEPAAYGFANVSDRCSLGAGACANPDQYLFWDDRHPTTAGHRVLASYALDVTGAQDGTEAAPGLFNPLTALFELFEQVAPDAASLAFNYGQARWVPLVGDWNGDGRDTVGLYNPTTSRFFLRDENSAGPATMIFRFGQRDWTPLRGDWDGDGIDTVGVYNSDTGRFFIRSDNTSGPATVTFRFGRPDTVPVVGDWDGDGVDSIGVYNSDTSRFFLRNLNSAGPESYEVQFGQRDWIPVVGDWDRNGTDTVGVYNPDTGRFFLRNLNLPGTVDETAKLGRFGSLPIAGDWDGPEPTP
jgi:phospholipase/lecithinase/hemolysin